MAAANNEFFEALSMLEHERGITAEYLIDKIKAAIVIAVKKNYEVEDDHVMVEIDPNTGHIVKDKPPENRCLIPTDMMDEYGIRLGDWIWLEAITYPYTNSNDTQIIQVAFRVVGAFVQTGRANNIYANLDMPKYFLDLSMASVYEWSTQDLPGGTILTRGGICMRQAYSGATFSVPSCADLTAVKQALHDMGLSEVGRISSIRNFVIINDAAYLTTERAAAQRLWYMQHLFPVVYAIALGLAYLLAFLQVQSRRRELRTCLLYTSPSPRD